MNSNTVFITGAARRVGVALAGSFHARGWRVIAHCRELSGELAALQRSGVTVIKGDLSTVDGALSLAAKVHATTRTLRAVINNASKFEKSEKELNRAADQYQMFFMTHMMAPYLLTEALRDLLEAHPEGRSDVINMLDIYAERPTLTYDLYASTKAGLASLTRSFAKKLGPKVKVNGIAPGLILFPGGYGEEEKQRILANSLLKSEGGTESVVSLVHAILDNPFMTGAIVNLDGGRSLMI